MGAFSDNLTNISISLINQFGEDCSIERCTEGAYDPSTLSSNPVCNTVLTAKCVPDEYMTSEFDGTIIQTGDIKIYIAPDIATGIVPRVDDKILVNSTSFRIVNVKQIRVEGANVLFELQVRK